MSPTGEVTEEWVDLGDDDARPSAPETVLRRLRDAILDGRLPSGTRLKINDLAADLNVSHMPVREALHLLVMEGLAVREPRRGVVVRPLTAEDVAGAYHVLGTMQGLAARHAAETLSAEEVAKLRSLLASERELIASGDRTALLRLNRTFHGAIQERFPNTWADTFVAQLHNYTYRVRRTYPQTDARLQAVATEHEAILAAIAVGDGDAAERLTRLHNERASQDLITQIKESAPPEPGAVTRRRRAGGRA